MSSVSSNAAPLLTAFRAAGPTGGRVAVIGPWFQAFLTLCGCMMPVAVCLYLVRAQPLFEFQSVEFTAPDVVAGVVVIAVVGRALIKGFHFLPRFLSVPFFLLFFATLLSAIFAIDKVHGAAALIQELEFMALAWAFAVLTDAKSFLRIVHFILGIFVFESLIAGWQFLLGADMPTGTFIEHQQYAFFTSFAAVMALALVSNEANPRKRFLYIVTLAILLVGSLLGLERAPWLSFVVGAMAVTWYSGKGKKRKRLLVGFGITAVAAIVLVASVPRLREVTVSRIAEAEKDSERRNSLLSRLLLWKIAYDLFLQNPVLGIGPKNFQIVIPHLASLEEMQGLEKVDPHNVWIGMLAEQGVVGFVTYVAFCCAVIKVGTSRLRTPSLPSLSRSLCLVYIAYFFFWLTMSYPFFQKGAGHFDFMLIGLMLGLQESRSPGYDSGDRTIPLKAESH